MKKLRIFAFALCLFALTGMRTYAQSDSSMQIVFSSDVAGPRNVHIMNSDGSNFRRLETLDGQSNSPACSPDGTQISFAYFNREFTTINRMNADGSANATLTGSGPEITSSTAPTWSPNGNQIAFASNLKSNVVTEGYDLYIMNSDGTNRTLVFDDVHSINDPAWSPDGNSIAFTLTINLGMGNFNSDIYTINPDGSNLTQITNDPAMDESPSWSPDSSQIVFESDRDGNKELYRMNANGMNVVRLTNNNAYDGTPSWSPDGNQIAFASDRHSDGDSAIYVMDMDGNNVQLLTPSDLLYTDHISPCWLASAPLPSLSIASATGAEGTTIAFTVTLDSEATDSFTVDYNVTNVTTSSEDFVGDVQPSGTLTFNGTAGEQQFIDIATANDDIGENGEFFLVQLTNVIPSGDFRIGVTPSDVVALGTITDSDPINPDVNGDGLVTPADAIFVINRIGEPLDAANATADVDGDGEITNDDALKVIMRLGETLE